MTTSRDDAFTTSEADAAWFERGHAPTPLEAAIADGYDPTDDTGTFSAPLSPDTSAAFERAVRARDAAFERVRKAGAA